MRQFNWGVFGTGAISAKFIAGLASARNAKATMIASRAKDTAEQFAAALGIERAVGGYSAAVGSGAVDAIYIATPPAYHAEHALLCLEAGVPVLIEKPIAFTRDEAARIATAARANSVFAMEAMWTRFLPAARAMRARIASGEIGEVRVVSGNFGTSQVPDQSNGMFNASMGGGALSHLGAYPLSMAQWLFGAPTSVQATGTVGETGVDEDVAISLTYPGNVTGSFFVSSRAWAPDDFTVMGTHGMIGTRGSIVRPHGVSISRQEPIGREVARFDWKARMRQNAMVHSIAQRLDRSSRSRSKGLAFPYTGNGYHYEADEVRACIERGAIESQVMPLDDSVAVIGTIEDVRNLLSADKAKEGRA